MQGENKQKPNMRPTARYLFYQAKKRQKEMAERKAWQSHLNGIVFKHHKVNLEPRADGTIPVDPWLARRKVLKAALIKNLRPYELPVAPPAWDQKHIVAFDMEFTGHVDDDIMEIGAVKVNLDTRDVHFYQQMVRPRNKVTTIVRNLTGITNSELRDKPRLNEILPDFFAFVGKNPLVVGHGIGENDLVSLNLALDRYRGLTRLPNYFLPQYIDTVHWAMQILPKETPKYNLHALSEQFHCAPLVDHRALDDAITSLLLLRQLLAFGKLDAHKMWDDSALDEMTQKLREYEL